MILRSETQNFYDNLAVENFEDVRKSEAPSIVLIKNELGIFSLIAILNIIVKDFVSSFNVGKQVSVNQIPEISKAIIDEFYWLKIEDFKLCFSNAKKGHYGNAYDRIDIAVIFEWLNNYCDERANYFSLSVVEKNTEQKKEPIDYEAVKEWYKNNRDFMVREETKEEKYHKYKVDRMKQEQLNNPNPKGEIKK